MFFGIILLLLIAAIIFVIAYDSYLDRKIWHELKPGDKLAPKSIMDPFLIKKSDVITFVSKEESPCGCYVLYTKNGIEKSIKFSEFVNSCYKLPENNKFVSKRVMKTIE